MFEIMHYNIPNFQLLAAEVLGRKKYSVKVTKPEEVDDVVLSCLAYLSPEERSVIMGYYQLGFVCEFKGSKSERYQTTAQLARLPVKVVDSIRLRAIAKLSKKSRVRKKLESLLE